MTPGPRGRAGPPPVGAWRRILWAALVLLILSLLGLLVWLSWRRKTRQMQERLDQDVASAAANVRAAPLATGTKAALVQGFSSSRGGSAGSSPFLRPENMVHQTMNTRITSAARASSRIRAMNRLLWWHVARLAGVVIVGIVAGCAAVAPQVPAAALPPIPVQDTGAGLPQSAPLASDASPLPPPVQQPRSRWVPVRWAALPGFAQDDLQEAWNAWTRSCERPPAAFAALCPDIRLLSLGTAQQQRDWMVQNLQPFRVEAPGGPTEGLLTAYFEPLLEASRIRKPPYLVPLYRPPPGLATRKPWYTRQEMETLPIAREALRGLEIAWLADPVDALVLQIQGSGRLRVTEPDGTQRVVRLAFAASNEQPYVSVGRWLLDAGLLRDASWPSIKGWVQRNPQRVSEMLWSNPRTVFFREEALSELDAGFGPRGAQGVALTPGRSIAVDRDSIPYGTPVWLVSTGPQLQLQRLVLAQDTGSAIVGAVRADYFVGWGAAAGDVAGRLKQSLQMWVLWPK